MERQFESIQNLNKPKLQRYYKKVFAIGDVVLETFSANSVQICGTPLLYTQGVDSYHNRIPFNGGIALEYFCGMPSAIYTPLGRMGLASGLYSNFSARKQVYFSLQRRLGLIEINPEKREELDPTRPVYSIMKDASGHVLPQCIAIHRLCDRALMDGPLSKEANDLLNEIMPTAFRPGIKIADSPIQHILDGPGY